MNMTRPYSSPLRERQVQETRRQILDAALKTLQESEESFTHESIAANAGIALRTVYRHFPSRADLLDAVWQESDRYLQLTHYPASEAELLHSLEAVYGRMDERSALIRALLNTSSGREMRRRDNERRLHGIEQALCNATQHLESDQRRHVIAVFQVLFSARTWEMMRDRAHLGDGETAKAVRWAMETLLDSLHRNSRKRQTAGKSSRPKKAPRAYEQRVKKAAAKLSG